MAGEHDDMMVSWGHFYLTINEKAIPPRGEAKSNAEIFRLLAAGMDYDDHQFKMGDMELAEHYVKWDAPQMAGIGMEHFRKHGYFHLAVGTPDDRLPHANGNFPTPSGRVEFMVRDAKNFVAPPFRMMYEAMQSGEDVDPLPGYMPPRESPESNAARAAFPQFLLSQRAAQD